MAQKIKTRQITITDEGGTFTTFFRRLAGEKEDTLNFEGLAAARNILSNEKARLLHIVKIKKPSSLYTLAKLLGRNFKSVYDDVKLLEKFGFLDLIIERTGKRQRLKPVVVVDSVNIEIRI